MLNGSSGGPSRSWTSASRRTLRALGPPPSAKSSSYHVPPSGSVPEVGPSTVRSPPRTRTMRTRRGGSRRRSTRRFSALSSLARLPASKSTWGSAGCWPPHPSTPTSLLSWRRSGPPPRRRGRWSPTFASLASSSRTPLPAAAASILLRNDSLCAWAILSADSSPTSRQARTAPPPSSSRGDSSSPTSCSTCRRGASTHPPSCGQTSTRRWTRSLLPSRLLTCATRSPRDRGSVGRQHFRRRWAA